MRVELHDGLRDAYNLQATRVVVYDEYDNPIAAIVKIEDGRHIAVTASNKQFQSFLKALGINKTLIVQHIDPSNLPSL